MTTVRGHRDDTPSKTSLNFICAPGSGFEKHSNKSVRNNLENLPRDVVSLIAYHLVVDDTGVGQHPSPLIPLFLTSRRTYEVLCFEQNPKLYYDLYKATFDHAALTRRYDWMIKHLSDVAGRGRKVYDLFGDPKSWATEYKSRWELSWLMREVGRLRKLDIPGFCDTKEVEAALWSVWFLVTENGELSDNTAASTTAALDSAGMADTSQMAKTFTSCTIDAIGQSFRKPFTSRICSETRLFLVIPERRVLNRLVHGRHCFQALVSILCRTGSTSNGSRFNV